MTEHLSTRYGNEVVSGLIDVIVSNREYLSEIDGAIGDGDHGINMAKGFSMCGAAIAGRQLTLAQAFDAVSDALMEGIGGSMGPLYGSLFMGMADSVRDKETLDQRAFLAMLRNGLSELQDISSASVGDKCLMDTLIPAVAAFEGAVQRGDGFSAALEQLKRPPRRGGIRPATWWRKSAAPAAWANVRAACWTRARSPAACCSAGWPTA